MWWNVAQTLPSPQHAAPPCQGRLWQGVRVHFAERVGASQTQILQNFRRLGWGRYGMLLAVVVPSCPMPVCQPQRPIVCVVPKNEGSLLALPP